VDVLAAAAAAAAAPQTHTHGILTELAEPGMGSYQLNDLWAITSHSACCVAVPGC
jgi:hypothetical protein